MLLWRGRSREEQEPRAAPRAERVRHEQPRPVAPPETSAGPQWAPGSGSLWEVLSLTLGAWLWVGGRRAKDRNIFTGSFPPLPLCWPSGHKADMGFCRYYRNGKEKGAVLTPLSGP